MTEQEPVVDGRRYRGVRGWLLFFIAMVFLAPVINLLSQRMVSAALEPFGQWPGVNTYLALRFLLLMAFSIYGIYCGVALLKKDRGAVTHAKAFCWLALGLPVVLVLLPTLLIGDPRLAAPIAAQHAIGGFFGMVGSVIWLLYFKYSKRVRMTYQGDTVETVP